MARDFVRLMHAFFLPAARSFREVAWRPAVDVYRTSRGWLLKFDLAGVRREDLDVTVLGNRVTVRGVRRDACVGEACDCHLMEISYNEFERSVDLPENVQSAQVEAEHREGMLLIRIHREGNR
jgi:HSP20 family protein